MFTRLGHHLCLGSAVRHGLFSQHKRTIRSIAHLNQKQGTEENKELQDISNDDHKYDIKEQEKGISGFERPDIVAGKPLLSLDITDKMKKMNTSGSLPKDMFVGKLYADSLVYPECLDNRKEYALLYDQYKMVHQLWPKVWNDPVKLQQFNFNNMYELSVTEMMTILDAIGTSSRRCYETDLSKPLPKKALNRTNNIKRHWHIGASTSTPNNMHVTNLMTSKTNNINLTVTRGFHAEGSIKKYLDFRHKFRTNHLRLHLKIIRRQKMKKHKLKKFRKKFKTLIAKRRFKREIIKEKTFRTELLSMIRDAEEFDPKEYARKAIERAQLESKKVSWPEVYEEIREKCRVNRYQTWYIKPRHKRDPDLKTRSN